jgi:hypothetical protein
VRNLLTMTLFHGVSIVSEKFNNMPSGCNFFRLKVSTGLDCLRAASD